MNALVTGAGGAIGLAVAQALATQGATVFLADISQRRLESARDSLTREGITVHALRADVTDPEQAAALVTAAAERMGGIDTLVNVVGGYAGDLYVGVLELELKRFREVLQINLLGTFIMTQLAARTMLEGTGGSIVNISSIAAHGARGQSDYSAAKAGVIAFTRSCALELAPRIRVNAVVPGVIQTAVFDRVPLDVQAAYLRGIPLSRFGAPEDVAAAVMFLSSDSAAYISGETLTVSGGFLG